MNLTDRIRTELRSKSYPRLTISELLQRCACDLPDLTRAIQTLLDSEEVITCFGDNPRDRSASIRLRGAVRDEHVVVLNSRRV